MPLSFLREDRMFAFHHLTGIFHVASPFAMPKMVIVTLLNRHLPDTGLGGTTHEVS